MHLERLQKIVDHLEGPPENWENPIFNFSCVSFGHCGCVLGEFSRIFPGELESLFKRNFHHEMFLVRQEEVEEFLGVNQQEFKYLFFPTWSPASWNRWPLGIYSSRKSVTQGIKNFIEWKQKEENRVQERAT